MVGWHTGGLEVDLTNAYRDVQIIVGNGFAKGTGTDTASGFLARMDDGTYRGLLDASVNGSFSGATIGADCSDTFSGTQQLLAIGQPDVLGQTVSLRFYPASPPSLSTGSCTAAIPFPGGGPDLQAAGTFLPFNDTRWTTQNGFVIDVPATGLLEYLIPSPPACLAPPHGPSESSRSRRSPDRARRGWSNPAQPARRLGEGGYRPCDT